MVHQLLQVPVALLNCMYVVLRCAGHAELNVLCYDGHLPYLPSAPSPTDMCYLMPTSTDRRPAPRPCLHNDDYHHHQRLFIADWSSRITQRPTCRWARTGVSWGRGCGRVWGRDTSGRERGGGGEGLGQAREDEWQSGAARRRWGGWDGGWRGSSRLAEGRCNGWMLSCVVCSCVQCRAVRGAWLRSRSPWPRPLPGSPHGAAGPGVCADVCVLCCVVLVLCIGFPQAWQASIGKPKTGEGAGCGGRPADSDKCKGRLSKNNRRGQGTQLLSHLACEGGVALPCVVFKPAGNPAWDVQKAYNVSQALSAAVGDADFSDTPWSCSWRR